MARRPRSLAALGDTLERLRATYGPADLQSDPLRYVHRYAVPADREVVGWLAGSLAFGRVASIFGTLDRLLPVLGSHPAATVASWTPAAARRGLRGVRHRWIGEPELAAGLMAVRELLLEFGSLESAFMAADPGSGTVREGLRALHQRVRDRGPTSQNRGFRFLFPCPDTGACKRANLFLRWMVRPADGVDLGLWKSVDPARLVMPLDTHVAALGRALRLTRRVTPGWSMAEDITASLRRLCPEDPVRYDWAMSRLGILGHCPHRRNPSCEPCPIFHHCRL